MWGYGTTSLSQRPQRENGSGNPSSAQAGRAADHLPETGDRQRHPTCCAPAAPGGCCPMTCRRGASITSAPGVGTELAAGPRHAARMLRRRAGRPAPARPSSQPVGPRKKGYLPRGYDAGKKVKGRKRHIVVIPWDCLAVAVHPADIQDRDRAVGITAFDGPLPSAKLIWADGAYGGKLVAWAQTVAGWTLELVRRPAQQHTFQVLPRRWVVERTFGWLNRQRRLSKDYEALCETTETWIYISMTGLMLRRLAQPSLFLDTLLGRQTTSSSRKDPRWRRRIHQRIRHGALRTRDRSCIGRRRTKWSDSSAQIKDHPKRGICLHVVSHRRQVPLAVHLPQSPQSGLVPSQPIQGSEGSYHNGSPQWFIAETALAGTLPSGCALWHSGKRSYTW